MEWAVHKCRLYLAGQPFALVTDHRPLVPIINKYSLDQVENPRLVRLLLKLQQFQISASWRKGSEDVFADALSRNPVDLPRDDEQFGEDASISSRGTRACISRDNDGDRITTSLPFHELREIALSDQQYQ